jgi:hypothetical protein
VARAILGTVAATLQQAGVTHIDRSAQAAAWKNCRRVAFLLFAPGMIGTGVLSVPVLAGSSPMPSAKPRTGRSGRKPAKARGF